MARTYRSDTDDNDDDFLHDKHHGRVPLMLRDAQPRWVADADRYFGERAANSRVIGIDGMPESLHQPGYRFGDANHNKAALDAAYRAEDDYLQNAWKGANREGHAAGSDGTVCTVSDEHFARRRETDHRTVDQMIRDHQSTMAATYAAYESELSETWRRS